MGFLGLHGLLEPSWLSGLHDLYDLYDLYGLHGLFGLPLMCVIVSNRHNLYITPFGLFDLFGPVLYNFYIITSGFLHKLIPNS